MSLALVRIEVYLSGGLPVTQIVGLAETSVRESRERVRAAPRHVRQPTECIGRRTRRLLGCKSGQHDLARGWANAVDLDTSRLVSENHCDRTDHVVAAERCC